MKEPINKVLFVDDDEHILKSIKRSLIKEPYEMYFAFSGREALNVMKRNNISVIITDMKMPGMNGLELLKIIKDEYPNTIKIVLSGYAQIPQILATVNQVNIFRFITKPWETDLDLKQSIREGIKIYNFESENQALKLSLEKKNALYQKLLVAYDEKLMLSKNDFANIFEFQTKINQYLMNLYAQYYKKEIDYEVFSELILLYNETNKMLKSYFPVAPRKMTLEEFEKDLIKFLYESQKVEQSAKVMKIIQFQLMDQPTQAYKVNYKLLLYVFKLIFENLIPNPDNKTITVGIKHGEIVHYESLFKQKIIFLINQAPEIYETNKDLRMLSELLITSVLNSIEGTLQISESNGMIASVIEIDFVLEQTEFKDFTEDDI